MIGTAGRGGCPTTDWEYATETAHRGMRSCADLRDNDECWSSVHDLVGYTLDGLYHDVAESCPCCHDSAAGATFLAFGSEPGTVRANANSAAAGTFYSGCYTAEAATVGHVDACYICIEYGAPGTGVRYTDVQTEAICPEYTQNSEMWCEQLGSARPGTLGMTTFDNTDEAACNSEPCCHWTRDRGTGGKCWSSLGDATCKAENIWNAEQSTGEQREGICPGDPDRTFEGPLYAKDLPRIPNRPAPNGATGWEFWFSCKWFNDQPVWRACLGTSPVLVSGGIIDQDPGKEGERCPGAVLSIYYNSAAGVSKTDEFCVKNEEFLYHKRGILY